MYETVCVCVLCSDDEYYVNLCGSIPDLTGEQSISQFVCVHTLYMYNVCVYALYYSTMIIHVYDM